MNDRGPPTAVEPLRWPCDADLVLPGSKSEASRMLVAAAMSGRTITVTGATPCDDVRHLVAGLAALGYEARFTDEARGTVRVGPRVANAAAGRDVASAEIFCGNAGTALRFLVSVAAITPGTWTITGDAAMSRRPVRPLVAAWRQLGVDISDVDGCPPVRVRGGGAAGNRVELDPTVSSQFVSSLLLVGATLPDGLDIEFAGRPASIEYAQLTCAVLRQLGAEVTLRSDGASVRRGKDTMVDELRVGGDWSAMGIWTCLLFLSRSVVRATNLRHGSGQPDEQLLRVLAPLCSDGERTFDVSAVPDQFLNLAVVAALRTGTTRLVGAASLRHKECDRIAVMARELARAKVAVQELHDGLVVHGQGRVAPAVVDPERDHRVAMAWALLGLLVPGITVSDPGCVTKSYPMFWQHVECVQRSPRCVAVVGMRGAGKSTFASALAKRTGLEWIDTDRLFEARHGPIAAFVARHGWHAFRAREALLVAASIAPGCIVSTGGGAIEHEPTRLLLRTQALAVWLDGAADLLRARLLADETVRPSVTGAPPAVEVGELLARRAPLYASVAAVRLDAAAATPRQVDEALVRLRAFAHVFAAAQ